MTSSKTSQHVYARFSAEQFDNPIYMDVHIMGAHQRTYTKVQAPPTWEAPSPYLGKATPTLVIRKNGEAWDQPFAVVYEQFEDGELNKSIVRAFTIYQGDVLIGVQVDSQVDGKYVSHLILNPPPNTVIEQEDLELSFEGSFAIIAMNAEGEVTEMYGAEWKSLHFRSHSLIPAKGSKAAYWKKGD